MKKLSINIILILFAILIVYSCADKFVAPALSPSGPPGNINDTVYVQQFPVWEGFNKPQDILVGRETFIYVADTQNDRIVMMNIAGQYLGSASIKKPVAIAQDFRLNLIVCAQFDTLIDGNPLTYSAVFKVDMVSADHIIDNAPVKRLLPKTSFDFLRSDREYTGACVFYDNSFYIARRGPSNSNPIDPDNGILIFRQKELSDGSRVDTLVGRVPLVEPEGTGLLSANQLSSLTSLPGNRRDIIATMTGENSFKTQWWEYVKNEDFEGYQNYLEPFVTDLMQVNKFGSPEGVALDEATNIFVADAAKDSVFKFNPFGDEMESFGGPDVFDSPHGVSYFDKTLYVADTNNDRILRFILSTEID